ncbi:MAG: hypothetical protein LBP22_16930 [Deltaproteobacteria bacterium]|jgi:hypothetical protein|nr:hypothetical protein [Deltaproteobacteria bacterium]
MAKNVPADQKKNKKNQAKDLLKMLEISLAEDDHVQARAYYEAMSKFGRTQAMDSLKAKGAYKLIDWYVNHQQIELTKPLVQAISRRSNQPENLMMLLESVRLLVTALEAQGRTDEAHEMRLSALQPMTEESPKITFEAIKAALIELCFGFRQDEALSIFTILQNENLPEELQTGLKQLSLDLIKHLTNHRQPEAAYVFFLAAEGDKMDLETQVSLVPHISELTIDLAFESKYEEALKTFSFLENPEFSEVYRRHLLEAAEVLLDVLLDSGQTQMALDIWRRIPKISEGRFSKSYAQAIKKACHFYKASCFGGKAREAYQIYQEAWEKYYSEFKPWDGESQEYSQILLFTVRAVVVEAAVNPEAMSELLVWAAETVRDYGQNWPENTSENHMFTIRFIRTSMAFMIKNVISKINRPDLEEIVAQITEKEDYFSIVLGQAEALVVLTEFRPSDHLASAAKIREAANSLTDLLLAEDQFQKDYWEQANNDGIDTNKLVCRCGEHLATFIRYLSQFDQPEEASELFRTTPWMNFHVKTNLSFMTQAAYFLEKVDRSRPDSFDRPDETGGQVLFTRILAILRRSFYSSEAGRLGEDILNLDFEHLAQSLSLRQSHLLADKAYDLVQTWQRKKIPPTSRRILNLLAKLGDHREIVLRYYLCALRLMENFAEHSFQPAEAVKIFEALVSYLRPDEQAQVSLPFWTNIALLLGLAPLLRIYPNTGYRFSLDKHLKNSEELIIPGESKIVFLLWAGILQEMFERLSYSNSDWASKSLNHFYEWADRFIPDEDYTPLEAQFLDICQNDIRLSYLKYLMISGQPETALTLFRNQQLNLTVTDSNAYKMAEFLALAVKFLVRSDLTKAMELKKKIDVLAQTHRVESYRLTAAQSHNVETFRLMAAQALISFLVESNNFALARQIAMELEETSSPSHLLGRVATLNLLLEGYCSQNMNDDALEIYSEIKKAPFSISVYKYQMEALITMLVTFAKSGETGTAAHLFTSRDETDSPDFTAPNEEMDKLIADFQDNFMESARADPLDVHIDEIQQIRTKLGEMGLELIRDCLDYNEPDRAMAVYDSLSELTYADTAPINQASKLVMEQMLKNGQETEARIIAEDRAHKLPIREAARYQAQIDRLISSTIVRSSLDSPES